MAEIEELNIATRSFTLGSERELQSKLEETGIWHKVLKESWLRDPPPADELLFTPYCSPLPEELLFGKGWKQPAFNQWVPKAGDGLSHCCGGKGLAQRASEAFAAEAAGDADSALAKLKEAVAIEDSIDDLSQPPYPVIPATELAGNLLLDFNRPEEAEAFFQKTL